MDFDEIVETVDEKDGKLALHQAPEQRQILHVFFQVGLFRSLQAHGDAPEALVVHEQAEGLDADVAFADVLMAVDA